MKAAWSSIATHPSSFKSPRKSHSSGMPLPLQSTLRPHPHMSHRQSETQSVSYAKAAAVSV